MRKTVELVVPNLKMSEKDASSLGSYRIVVATGVARATRSGRLPDIDTRTARLNLCNGKSAVFFIPREYPTAKRGGRGVLLQHVMG